ncbi:MAG: hypothetical protein U1D55_02035 [Phycisphaerae bacterium]
MSRNGNHRARVPHVVWFPMAAICFLLLIVSGYVVAVWAFDWLLTLGVRGDYLALGAAGTLFFCLAVIYWRRMHLQGGALIFAGLAVVSTFAMVAATHFLLSDQQILDQRVVVALAACLLVLSLAALHGLRGWMTTYRTLRRRDAAAYLRRHPVETLFLLVSSNGDQAHMREGKLVITQSDARTHELSAESLDHTIEELAALRESQPPALHWNWEPILRAVKPHLGRTPRALRQIFLLGSRNSGESRSATFVPGSSQRLCDVKEILDHFLSRHEASSVRVELVTDLDFEGFSEVHDRLVHSILPELERNGVSSKRVLIDITGGQKLTAIPGALSALNDQAAFQYVQTNPPYAVQVYELRMEAPPRRL